MRKKAAEALVRCGGTLTESAYLAWIRSALRSRWLRWPPRAAALLAARRPYKGPKKLQKWEYLCSICTKWYNAKEVEVDHMVEAGSILSVEDIGPFANRLYCEVAHLRVLCKPCHKAHTLAQSKGISFEEALLEKRVNEQMKSKNLLAFLAGHGYTGSSVSNATKRKQLVTNILKGENT